MGTSEIRELLIAPAADAGVPKAAARVFVDLQPIGPFLARAIDAEHDAVARPARTAREHVVAHETEVGIDATAF